MLSRVTINIIRRSICDNIRTIYCARNFLQSSHLIYDSSTKQHNIQNHYNVYVVKYVAKRFKSSRKKAADKKKDRDDDSEEEEDYVEEAPVGSKIITVNVQSLRLDSICKVGFGTSRSKVEEAFYASMIRVNGKKVFKKSMIVEVGDEIDLILHRNVDNPEFLFVNRIVILSTKATSNSIQIRLSRDKNLLIENYEDPW